jgi:hypothetical protein
METNELFRPPRSTCSLNTDDVDLIDGWLQCRAGHRRARVTPCILGGKIAMREHTWYIREGFRDGREETIVERARLSLEMAMSDDGRDSHAIFVCDVQHGISWPRRKGPSRNSPK